MIQSQRDTIYKAFLQKFAFAPNQGVPECEIWKGYQNRIEAPPPEILVFQEILSTPIEMGNELFVLKDPKNGVPDTFIIRNLTQFTWQVSSRGKYSRARLDRVRAAWKSRIGATFMRSMFYDDVHGGAAPVGVGAYASDATKEEGTTDYMLETTLDLKMAARVVVEIDEESATELKGYAIPVEIFRS